MNLSKKQNNLRKRLENQRSELINYSRNLKNQKHRWKLQVGIELGAQWLSGRALDSRPKGCGFDPHRRHCVVSLSKNINPSLVLVQPRKIRPFITDRLLMGRKESNQTKQINKGRHRIFSYEQCWRLTKIVSVKLRIFSNPSVITFVLGAQKNRLVETVLLSTYNIY